MVLFWFLFLFDGFFLYYFLFALFCLQASHALAAQLHAARALYRHLLWKVVGVCLASLALVVLGGGWLSRHYYEEIRRHQVSAQLLQAYDAADVTLCDGRLCANIDPKGDRFGEDDQYRPVRDRR